MRSPKSTEQKTLKYLRTFPGQTPGILEGNFIQGLPDRSPVVCKDNSTGGKYLVISNAGDSLYFQQHPLLSPAHSTNVQVLLRIRPGLGSLQYLYNPLTCLFKAPLFLFQTLSSIQGWIDGWICNWWPRCQGEKSQRTQQWTFAHQHCLQLFSCALDEMAIMTFSL